MFQTTGLPLPSPRFLFRTVAVKAKFHTRAHVVIGFEIEYPGSAPIVTHKTRTKVVTKEILIISIILFKMLKYIFNKLHVVLQNTRVESRVNMVLNR